MTCRERHRHSAKCGLSPLVESGAGPEQQQEARWLVVQGCIEVGWWIDASGTPQHLSHTLAFTVAESDAGLGSKNAKNAPSWRQLSQPDSLPDTLPTARVSAHARLA